jgi:predicted DNA-binding transcriptional regulator AlpA
MHSVAHALRAAEARRIADLPDLALITRRELAVLLGLHRNTVADLDRRGLLPPAVSFGPNGRRRWRLADVRAMR